MPYMVVKHADDRWCVHEKGEDGKPGKERGCSETEEKAKAHMRALYAHHDEGKSVTVDAPEWAQDHTVHVKALTDDTVTVAGWGVLYGGMDLYQETFAKDTDYMLDLVPTKPVFYDHTLQDIKSVIGKAVTVEEKDEGLWVEGQLKRSDKYVKLVLQLIDAGRLGWSSGSAEHLVQRSGKTITRWPIVEFSLTPTPAEPRTLGVQALRNMAESVPAVKAWLAQDAAPEAVSPPATDETAEAPNRASETGATDMSDETQTAAPVQPAAPVVQMTPDELKALIEQASTSAVKQALENESPKEKGGLKVAATPKDPNEGKPFKSFGEFLQAVAKSSQQGASVDPRLTAIRQQGMSEGLPSDGGFLVQTDFAAELYKRAYQFGEITRRCRNVPISANANGLKINAIDETSRASTRWGGILAYWLAEAGTKLSSKPKLRQMELNLHKLIGLCYATDELLQDTSALESVITQGFTEEFSLRTEDAFVNGTGVGQPLGVLAGNCLVSVAKETGQDADTVVAQNVIKMWSRLWAPSRPSSAWFINQDVEPQLMQLNLGVGTGGQLVYMPPGGLSGTPYATLFGRPVIPVEYMPTVGDQGDILLADWGQYLTITKGGIQSASSIHVQFTTDETTFRFVYRVDGQPLWNSALTPFKGTNTLSPFVVLDARA